MSVIPKKQLLLILISLVCVLFIFLYSAQLRGEPAPTTSLLASSASPPVTESLRESCPPLKKFPADIETNALFPSLELEPAWMSRREYWGNGFEDRYTRRRQMWSQLPLKVIVMPHSHTDPGWLQTVEGYFATSTKSIISNVVNKLTQHTNMTFIWSEASYMFMWWDAANQEDRSKLRTLLKSGRLEITTGGWVMTDEANVDFFSMVDQLVEGHEFMRSELDVVPVSSWSVDSFGHGGAFPHLLSKAEIKDMVIMRIHYAWKEWLARHQNGDFLWKQAWESDGSKAPLCHNFPYDIYSIKHSCGPNPQTCLGFDFRHLEGEYNEFTAHYTPVNEGNVQVRAELLLDQYGRTGSLLPHNVVLVPLGDDFRYSNQLEFDQQYENYIQIMQFVNSRNYNAQITFGTLKDYFAEVRSRMDEFPTLTGDFHVYSDIFSEGKPAYWSGYYFTRPYLKLLSRQVSTKLRLVEILYTVGLETARKSGSESWKTLLTSLYPDLSSSRRSLALFQHHDAITGTSKAFVMDDYELKLNKAIRDLNRIEAVLVQYLMSAERDLLREHPVVHTNWRNKGEYPQQQDIIYIKKSGKQRVLLVNSLAHQVERAAYVRTDTANVCVYDTNNDLLDVQLSPTFKVSPQTKLDFSAFDVWFPVVLDSLSISVFRVEECEFKTKPSRVFCTRCPDSNKLSSIHLKSISEGSLQLENHLYKLLFDPETRLLKTVTNKVSGVVKDVEIKFSSYTSQIFRSGAYLLDVEEVDGVPSETPLFTADDIADVVIVSGPIFSEVRVIWEVTGQGGLSSFIHSVRLHHHIGPLSEAIHIENLFDLGQSPNFRDTEFFMRFETGVRNGEERRLFTDQAGLGMVERIYAQQAKMEGNYYPVTESAYIEDDKTRLTLLVDHASGVSSLQEGWLEVMVDKRTMHDDARGMGEGVMDSRLTRHRYTLLLEPSDPKVERPRDSLPAISILALKLSRYLEHPLSTLTPPDNLKLTNKLGLMSSTLPCDYDLVNLRSWNPSSSSSHALLILRRLAPDCSWASITTADCLGVEAEIGFRLTNLTATFEPTSLTGNHKGVGSSRPFTLSPMEIASFNVTFT